MKGNYAGGGAKLGLPPLVAPLHKNEWYWIENQE